MKRNSFPLWVLTLVGTVNCGGALEREDEPPSGTIGESIRNGPIVDAPSPDPTSPRPTRPVPADTTAPYSDLRVLGTLRFYDDLNVMEIPVINAGNAQANGLYGTVHLGPTANDNWDATLFVDGAPNTVHTLPAGATGWIQARYRIGLIDECQRYRLRIDVYHQMQTQAPGGPLVFANDSAIVKTPCPLKWTTPIDEARLYGQYPSTVMYEGCADPLCSATDLNLVATEAGPPSAPLPQVNPAIRGKSLLSIVSSYESPFGPETPYNGYKCFTCHNSSSDDSYIYRPPVMPPDKTLYIEKDDLITYTIKYSDGSTDWGRRTWAGPTGWAQSFVRVIQTKYDANGNPYTDFRKYPYMREVMQKWIDDGWQ